MSSLSRRYVRIVGVVSLYWFVSITMVFVNKSLLSEEGDRSAPVFVTWFQCLLSVAGCYIISILSRCYSGICHSFPSLKIQKRAIFSVMPLSAIFVAMITCNNLCLKNVEVSFYYVSRSLTTVFNVLFTYLILNQTTSFKATITCGVILTGFWLGVDQENVAGTLSLWGIIYGVIASAFVSLNAIFTKKVLPAVDDNLWLLTFYNNLNACIIFIPAIVFGGELELMLESQSFRTQYFWLKMCMGGLFGFAIGCVTGLQIQVTSPLTHNISGTAKAAAQTILATQINSEDKNPLWWVSNAIVLLGSLSYARVQQLEMKRAALLK